MPPTTITDAKHDQDHPAMRRMAKQNAQNAQNQTRTTKFEWKTPYPHFICYEWQYKKLCQCSPLACVLHSGGSDIPALIQTMGVLITTSC